MGLDLVELVMDVEHKFGLKLPSHVARQLTTPRRLIDHVCAEVRAFDDDAGDLPPDAAAGPWTRSAVAEAVRESIRRLVGKREFSDDADFIRDLGMG